jgi:hypothetical protein
MRKITFCLFVLLVTAPLWLEAQVIKIDVKKGQKYLLETSTNMSDSNDTAGLSMKMDSEYKNFAVYEVKDIEKNEITFQVTITRVIMKSSIMGEENTYDSDIDKESPEAKMFSKQIGKPRKIVISNNGIIVKQDEPEKTDNPMGDWDFTTAKSSSELFIPLLIGKEFKPGASFPYLDSFLVEKNTTSFSLNKEKMDSRDSGTYTITGIESGIASISFTGTRLFSMLMNMNGKPMNSISKSVVRSELRVDIISGMVLNITTTEDATLYSGKSDKLFTSTNKSSSTTKVTLIQ